MGKRTRFGRRIGVGLALAAAGASPAWAAGGAGQSRAAVIEPLSLINTGPLLFGDIASGATPGTVVINQNTGTRTVTGGVTGLGGTTAAASFLGAAAGLNLVFIRQPTVPVTLTRVSGAQTMRVTALTIQGGQFRLFATRQAFAFNIGGTLAVGANQAEGTYVGTFTVTVDYF